MMKTRQKSLGWKQKNEGRRKDTDYKQFKDQYLCVKINRNSQLKDNDLKYRYIKSTNGINQENINKLENIFHFNRDKKRIREIRGKVAEFERKIKETIKKIELERSKAVITK